MSTPSDVVVVEAVRSPLGKRKGGLSGTHSTELLAAVQSELIRRAGIDPLVVGQVVGGCVGQVGMQTMNVTRNAWLTAGLPIDVAATTVDAQCGSSQQATNLAYALVKSGVVDCAIGCGVEVMSRVPMGSSIPRDPAVGKPVTKAYWKHHELTSQFEGAERIAKQWGITRQETDAFGKLSQDRAARAWAEGRFDAQIVPIQAPELDEERKPLETTTRITRDEGLRETTLEGLAGLRANLPDGVHTAGTSSQISDGAGAVLLMTREKAKTLGLEPKATILDSCLVGSDPVLMLTGPIGATQKLLAGNGLQMSDVELVEINEAFASVVLAWEKELKPDMETVNPNGGAIALGHPLGGTGAVLLTKAVHELERADLEHAVVTMCCGEASAPGRCCVAVRRAHGIRVPTPEPELDAPPWRRVESSLMTTARAIRDAYDARFASLDLNLTQASLLVFLHESGPLRQTQLAGRLALGRAATGASVAALEARGLVERQADPDDRRAWRVALTQAGKESVDPIQAIDRELRAELRLDISRDERQQLAALLLRLRKNLARVLARDARP